MAPTTAKHHWPCRSGSPLAGALPGCSEFADLPRNLDVGAHWSISLGSAHTPLVDADCNIYAIINGAVVKFTIDGFREWEADVEGGPQGTPVLFESTLILASALGEAYALDLATGRQKWRQKFCSVCGPDSWAASLSLEEGLVLMCGRDRAIDGPDRWNNTVYALDARTGRKRWKVGNDSMWMIMAAPCIASGVVLFQNMLGVVTCAKLKDGTTKWQVKEKEVGNTTGGVVAVKSAAIVTGNKRGRKAWNMPFGGKGWVRSYKISDGSKVWDREFGLEANTYPCAVNSGGKTVVIVGLGANIGTEEQPLGDEWPLAMAFLDAEDGALLHQLDFWPYYGNAMEGYSKDCGLQPTIMSNPTVSADGFVYFGTVAGVICVVDANRREFVSLFRDIAGFQGSVALGPGVIVACSFLSMHVFRAGPAAARRMSRILRPLERPLAESGTQHFWPHKQGNLAHTQASPWQGPTDLSTAFCEVVDIEDHWARRPGCDFYHKTAIVDSQGNVYLATNQSFMYVVRPDGKLRGIVDCGCNASNPVLDGFHLYCCDCHGVAVCIHIETLETVWSRKYCKRTGSDSWNCIMVRDMLITVGIDDRRPGACGGNDKVFALDRTNGETRWCWQFPFSLTYNFLPAYDDEKDLLFFMDQVGAVVCVKGTDGSNVWSEWAAHKHVSFSTGHVALCPNGLLYATHNSSKDEVIGWGCTSGRGVCDCYMATTGEVRWSREFPKKPAHVAPVAVPLKDGKFLCVVPVGENPAWPPYDEDRVPIDNLPSGDRFQGFIYALDGETGEDVWEWQTPVFHSYSAMGSRKFDIFLPDAWGSPSVDARGTLYVCYCNGLIYALKGASGELLGQFDMRASTQAAPCVVPGMVIVPTALRLCIWRDRSLEEAWVEEARAEGDPRAAAGPLTGDSAANSPEEAKAEEEALALGMRFAASAESRRAASQRPNPEPLPEPDGTGEAFYLRVKKRFEREAAEKAQTAPGAAAKPAPQAAAKPPVAEKAEAAKPTNPAAATATTELEADDDRGCTWKVVGGATTGGLVVRSGQGLKSSELGRLETGANVEELEVDGDRLHYKKLSGSGPDYGWVSLTFKGKELLKRLGA